MVPAAVIPQGAVMDKELGERFARALAAKDREALLSVLAPTVDFRGLTPNNPWQATSAEALVDDILLGAWFEPTDAIDELEAVENDGIADRERVAYRLRGHNPDGPFIVEQQAYLATEGGQINWLRILCSGFRPVEQA